MIDYQKELFGMSPDFWFTIIGSALPRSCIPTLFSCVIYLFVNHYYASEGFEHPYSIGLVASIIGFCVIFRSNSAIARYYEAATTVHLMYSKFGDAVTQAISFHTQQESGKLDDPDFLEKLVHHFSLVTGTGTCVFLNLCAFFLLYASVITRPSSIFKYISRAIFKNDITEPKKVY